MRLQLARRGFTIEGRDGTRRQFSWWVLTPFVVLPVGVLLALLFQSETVVRNYVSLARRDPAAIGTALWVFRHVNQKTLENLIFARPEPVKSGLPSLRLYLANDTLRAMQAARIKGEEDKGHDEGGNRPYFKAYLVDETGDMARVSVALRGAGKWHHRPEKPSLRVKISTKDIRRGRRYLELSRPEDPLALKNWIPDQIGHELGLLSDQGDHVRLFINNRYFGVYLRTMRTGESLALANGRMPGTFFKGDFSDRLWDDVAAWKIDGEASEADLAQFRRLLDLLHQQPTPDTNERLARLVDLDVYARWAALMIAVGSVHTDREHNHTYYLCSNQGLLEAMPWDVNGLGCHMKPNVPPELILHPLMDRVTRDPRWVHRRNVYLQRLLEAQCSPAQMDARVEAVMARLRADLEADVNLNSVEYMNTGLEVLPWSVLDIDPKREELEAWARARHAFLSAWLDEARVSVAPHPERPGWSRVTVWGSTSVRVARADGQPVRSDAWAEEPDLLHPGLSEALQPYDEASFERAFVGRYHAATPAALTYAVEGSPEQLRFTQALTGAPLAVSPAPTAGPPTRSLHPGAFPALPRDEVVLGPGEVLLEQDVRVVPGQRLVIHPGTTIRLKKGVGIYARGVPVELEGRKDAPIVLRAADPEPWGALAIARSPRVRLAWLDVEGGSTGTDGITRFKGMVDVYDCPDVGLRDCRFGPNYLGDDTVNLAESLVRVVRCRWERANSDALDLDMCRGEVIDCEFVDSGNDGLDMMTCRVRAQGCRFYRSGDKGISVGEASRALIEDCLFQGCWKGTEFKDDCRALFVACRFVDNAVGVNAYQKKWLYQGGGHGLLLDCHLSGSRIVDVSIKRRSSVALLGTAVDRIDCGQRLQRLEALPPDWQALRASFETVE